MNRALWLSLVAAVIVLPACSGGGDEAEEPVPTQAPTEVTTAVATEEAPPTEAPQTSGRTYRIRQGDTLSAIAQRFNTTVRALARLNDIEDPHDIKAGQRIEIPPPRDQ